MQVFSEFQTFSESNFNIFNIWADEKFFKLSQKRFEGVSGYFMLVYETML
jgi:hypothetical protein